MILARHGADEHTIVASILKPLIDAASHGQQATWWGPISDKFGVAVTDLVRAAAEPRFDVLGRERSWKATRFEQLSKLAEAPSGAVDVCVAGELHRIGAALVSIRRLGVEYLEAVDVPTPGDTLWWLEAFGEMITHHPQWARGGMVAEYRRGARELAERIREGCG